MGTYLRFVPLSYCLAESPPTRTIQTQMRSGESVQYDELYVTETDQCYQFTWIGISKEDNLSNNTESFPTCLDLENEFGSLYGREIPCFPPLVRTFNDENGGRSPNISEIVAACQQTGCNPFCPRAGGTCVKYTVTNRNKDRTVAWESHFCGEGIKWDG